MTPDTHTTIKVRAFDWASGYDLASAREILEAEFASKALETNPLLIRNGASNQLVAVFDYGSVAFFNQSEPQIKNLLAKLQPAAARPNTEVSEDDFTLLEGPEQRNPEGTEELYVKELNRD